MEVGRRLLVPEAFGFGSECVEMRKIGPHPNALPYAVILGFLEQASVSAPENFNATMRRLKLNTFFTSWVNELTSEVIESEQFARDFERKCNEFLDFYQIPRETDDRLGNIAMLLNELWISVSFNLGGFFQPLDEESKQFTLRIGVHRRVCFLLYQTLSKESFVILPCGHLQLRYKLMESLQIAAGRYAISSTENIAPMCCSDCADPYYSPELFTFAESLARGEYILTVPRQLEPAQLQTLECVLCSRRISNVDCAFSCECSETVCMQCMAISRLIAAEWKCPECGSTLKSNGHFDTQISQWKNLHSFLPSYLLDSEPNFPQMPAKKKCRVCERIIEIRHYLSSGEHMNCWVCDMCIKKQINAGERNCIKCHQEYSPGKLALLEEAKTSDGQLHTAADKSKPISLGLKMVKGSVNPVKIEEKYANCSRCASSVILSTLHKCTDQRAYCPDCCIKDIIMTCVDDDIRCRRCRQSFTNLDADVNRKQYACQKCGKLKILKEISHLCQNQTYYCWKCVQVDMNSGRIYCNPCSFNVVDKYSHHRKGKINEHK